MDYIYLKNTYHEKYGEYEKEFYKKKFNQNWSYINIYLGLIAILILDVYIKIKEKNDKWVFILVVCIFYASHYIKFKKKVKFYSDVTPTTDERIVFLKKMLHGNLNNETLDYLINKTLNKKNLLSENNIFSRFIWGILSFVSTFLLSFVPEILSLYKDTKMIVNIVFTMIFSLLVIILVFTLFMALTSEIRYEKKRCDRMLLLDLESIRYFKDKPIDSK